LPELHIVRASFGRFYKSLFKAPEPKKIKIKAVIPQKIGFAVSDDGERGTGRKRAGEMGMIEA